MHMAKALLSVEFRPVAKQISAQDQHCSIGPSKRDYRTSGGWLVPKLPVSRLIRSRSRSVFIFNADQFHRHIREVLHCVRGLGRSPLHKRKRWLNLKLARVEEDFPVPVAVDDVAALLNIERTGPTVRMDWLLAVGCDCDFEHSDVLILEDNFVVSRRCFQGIHVSPRTRFSGVIICLDLLNLDHFDRRVIRVLIRMRSLRGRPHHKGRHLLLRLLKLARVEDEFSVRITDDQVANLFDVDRAGPTMRVDWLFSVCRDGYFQYANVLILENDLVSFRRCYHAIQVCWPRACSFRKAIAFAWCRRLAQCTASK